MPLLRSVLSAMSLALAGSAGAGVVNVVTNAGFESGTLDPWYQDMDMGGLEDWNVTQSDARTGDFSGTVRGSKSIRQDFEPVGVENVLEASFWLRQPEEGFSIVAFHYDDGGVETTLINVNSPEWEFINITPFLNPDRKLDGLAVFGYSGGGLKDRTYLDDVVILVERTNCPEDLDGNGAVDFGDIIVILTAWGDKGGSNDIDSSGFVDIGDLLRILAAWGPCP